MSAPALNQLHEALRVDVQQLGGLEALSAAEQAALLAAIVTAKRKQKEALKAATEHSLSYIPALLRGAVRKILFG